MVSFQGYRRMQCFIVTKEIYHAENFHVKHFNKYICWDNELHLWLNQHFAQYFRFTHKGSSEVVAPIGQGWHSNDGSGLIVD